MRQAPRLFETLDLVASGEPAYPYFQAMRCGDDPDKHFVFVVNGTNGALHTFLVREKVVGTLSRCSSLTWARSKLLTAPKSILFTHYSAGQWPDRAQLSEDFWCKDLSWVGLFPEDPRPHRRKARRLQAALSAAGASSRLGF